MITAPPIEVIAPLQVDQAVARHRFVREALVLAHVFARRDERVIGTKNDIASPICQLYGWAQNVARHVDNTGWVYFMPVLGETSVVYSAGKHVPVRNGDVCRLNDRCPHGTYDETERVCLFVGPYERPSDGVAFAALMTGLLQLGAGSYEAPRLSNELQYPGHDECYALVDGVGRLMLRAEAERRRYVIATCSQCGHRAWKLDSSFPWCWDLNYCERHIPKRAAA